MDSPIRVIMKWAGPDRKYLIASVVCAFFSGLMTMVPYFGVYQIMVAAYEGTCTWEVITANATLVAAGVCVQFVFFGFAGGLSHKGAYNTLFRVRCRVIDHLAHAPLGQLDERSTGSIKTVLSEDIEKLELFLAHNVTEAVMYLTGPGAAVIFLCTVNVPLALATLVPFAVSLVILGIIFSRMSSVMERASRALSRMNAVMVEYVRGMRVIKALNMGSKSFRRFQEAVDEEHSVWCAISRKTGPGFAAFLVVIECGMLVMVPFGGLMFTSGAISGATFLLFAFVGSLYLTEIRLLQEIGSKFAQVKSGAVKTQELLDVPVFEGGEPFPATSAVKLENVRFGYDGEHEVLHGIDLAIRQGERLAVVGPSGAGKTTIVELVSRFYDVSSGSVSIGGLDVRDIEYDDLLSHVGVVFQKTFLTSGSILENIRMGKEATYAEVREAARKARIDDFIMGLPQGYNTEIGTLGDRLSGGQRQRIAIARAILKNAPVLILDEATSAADPENQLQIDEAIASLCEGKTVIIVAHRLGVVRTCDRVAVVEDGRIAAVGTHEDVLATCPYYRKAWEDYDRARSITFGFDGGSDDATRALSCEAACALHPSSVPPADENSFGRTLPEEADGIVSADGSPCAPARTADPDAFAFAADAAPTRSVFAKNRDFCVSIACTVVDGLLQGCNFGLIFMVMLQVFGGTADLQSLLGLTGALAVVFAARLAIYAYGYVRGQIGGARVSRTIRMYLGDKIKRIPLSRFTERSSGDYLNALTANVNDYEQILTHKTGSIVRDIALAVMLTCFVLWLYPPAGGIVAVSYLLIVPAMAFSWHQVKRYGTRKSAICASNTSSIVEHVTGMQMLRAYGIGGVKNTRIVESMRAYSDISFWYEVALIPVGGILSILVGLCQPLMFLVCGSAYLAGSLEAVPFILIIMLPLFMNKLVNSIFVNLTAYKNLMIAKNRIKAVVDEPEEAGSFALFAHEGFGIELAHVGFEYCKGEPVFSDMRLVCGDGALTALVGDSGCGKSTALNLIAQYYEPDTGTVSIGGTDTAPYAPESVLADISIVDQNVFLFDDSVMDNIRYARPDATDEEVVDACRLANADGFIRVMAHGYASVIGENGGKLSGGERQRLSIARAILRDSPIVLLDEATASLDIENELAVKEAIENLLAKRKTVVMVAHTLAIVRGADSIAVIGEGGVLEQGTHDELVAKGGKYARMWEADRKLV